MKTSCLAVLFLILTSSNILQAQDYTFYHYGLDDGLSQETVRNWMHRNHNRLCRHIVLFHNAS